MKVSIIIPVYNVEKYINETIESCLHQTMDVKDYEIIIINDGSTDKSVEIINLYKKNNQNIKLYNQKNDGAPGKARNVGIKKAKGETLLFLDSDDKIPKKALEILYNKLISTKSDIVIGKNIRFNDNGKVWGEYTLDEETLYFKKTDYFKRDELSAVVHTRLYKTSLIKNNKIEFIRKYPSQDTCFSTIANYYTQKITIIDEVVYFYRDRIDRSNISLMQKRDIRTINGRLIVMSNLVLYFYNIDKDYAKHLFNYRLRGIINLIKSSYINTGDLLECLIEYIKVSKFNIKDFIPYNLAFYKMLEKYNVTNKLFWTRVRLLSLIYYTRRIEYGKNSNK
jgi:glycosyltransferase involved in cell wall biosynthesis